MKELISNENVMATDWATCERQVFLRSLRHARSAREPVMNTFHRKHYAISVVRRRVQQTYRTVHQAMVRHGILHGAIVSAMDLFRSCEAGDTFNWRATP